MHRFLTLKCRWHMMCMLLACGAIAWAPPCRVMNHFRGLLFDLRLEQLKPTVLDIDNSSCINVAEDYGSSSRTRHIARRHMRVREFVHRGILHTNLVPSTENI